MSTRRLVCTLAIAAIIGAGLGVAIMAVAVATDPVKPALVTPVTAGPAVPRSLP